jgi:hypothetical protein
MSFDELKTQFHEKTDIFTEHKEALARLVNIVGEPLEGNAIYQHGTLREEPRLLNKQLNLFWVGKQAETTICEIGFNAGHSTLLFLLGNTAESLRFTIFDIASHSYVPVCFEYIQSKFPNVNFELIIGDSTITVPKFVDSNSRLIGTYDVVHVDGGHLENVAKKDMSMAKQLVRIGGIIVVDDTDHAYINSEVEKCIKSGSYIEINIFKSEYYEHRILRRIV